MYTYVASNLYLGANNDGIKDGIELLKERKILPEDVPYVKVPETLLGSFDARPKLKYYTDVLDHLKKLSAVYQAVEGKRLLIGGDHAIGIPSVAVSLNETPNLGVVWIDAHTDINTDQITNSGHIHGMSVASVMGLGEKELASFVEPDRYLKPENLVYIGLRDVEPAEQQLVDEMNILNFPYAKVTELGLEEVLRQINEHFQKQGIETIHLSYDLDSADPTLVPGVSTPVPGGFDLAETLQIMDNFFDNYTVSNMDIVEFNPKNDNQDKTYAFLTAILDHIHSI